MADRRIRTILEAQTSGFEQGMQRSASAAKKAAGDVDKMTASVEKLDKAKAAPEIDLQIDETKKFIDYMENRLKDLNGREVTPQVTVDIAKAEAKLEAAKRTLSDLEGAKAEITATADTGEAEKKLEQVDSARQAIDGGKANLTATADTGEAEKKLGALDSARKSLDGAKAKIVGSVDIDSVDGAFREVTQAAETAGTDGGAALGNNLIAAVVAIPIAGAVIGLGAAIAAGIWDGIQDGLSVDAGRDLFGARTGMDEATSAKFGRAAGEAYADAFGQSIEANMETARVAMEQGLLDRDATTADIEHVISALSGVTEIMQVDIPGAARAAGQMVRTGMARDFDHAMDILVAGYQNGANASYDLLDTLEEYPTHFRDLGLSGEEATGLLIQGLEGGAFNADKVADALKELTLQVKKLDNQAAGDALREIGLGHEDMARAFTEGGPAARDALGQILDGLQGIEDPAERAGLMVDLFGTQAEDMAGALDSLDLSSAVDELGGVEGAAGAAERAMATMADNTATEMESARRNIELASDGIKGALAAAFSDEIAGFASWVQENRGAVMIFFADLVNGAINMAIGVVGAFQAMRTGFLNFKMETLFGLSEVGHAIDAITPGDQSDMWLPMEDAALATMTTIQLEAENAARGINDPITQALLDTQAAFNDWLGPELLAAHVHDGITRATNRLDELSAAIDATGGTVTINGETVNAEQATQLLVDNINEETGTVTVDGVTLPAEKALDYMVREINAGRGNVTIGAKDNTKTTLKAALANVNASTASINIKAIDNASFKARQIAAAISQTSASIKIYGQKMLNSGGWVPTPQRLPGKAAGGWVPGPTSTRDNILWPTTLPGLAGGGTLSQPLTGQEFVVNAPAAARSTRLLPLINQGRINDSHLGGAGAGVLTLDGTPITAVFPGLGEIRGVIRQEISADHAATAAAGGTR